MKIAVVPDAHLNRSVYKGVMDRKLSMLPFRNVDFMKSFEWIVNKCIDDLRPDLFVIPGDVYDNFDPSNEVRGFFSAQIYKLTNAGIPVVILIGNHDVCMKHHALKDLQELNLKNVKILEQPMIMKFKGVDLFFFPYSLDIEQKKVTIKEAFYKFVEKIRAVDKGDISIFFGHFGVKGAKISEYVAKETTNLTVTEIAETNIKSYININEGDITPDDLDSIGSDYVLLGDFHAFQILDTKNCIAMYPGSIEKASFSEMNQTKGFILFDSESENDSITGKCKFIEYPHCRPMLELKGSFKKIKDMFDKCDHSKYQDAIVKINFIGSREELIEFSAGIESLKKEIKEALDPIHLYHEQKMDDEKQKKAVSELEKNIMEEGNMTQQDVFEVVKEIISEKITNKTEARIIIDLALETYKGLEKK